MCDWECIGLLTVLLWIKGTMTSSGLQQIKLSPMGNELKPPTSYQARNDFHRIRDVFNMIPPFENRETNLDHKRIVWSWFIFTGSEFLFLSLICNFLFFVFLHLPNPSLQEPKWKGGGLCGNSPLYSANPVSVGYYLSGGIYTVSVQTVNTQCQWMEVYYSEEPVCWSQWNRVTLYIPLKLTPILNPLNTP